MTQHIKDFIMWMGIGVGVYVGLVFVILLGGQIIHWVLGLDNPFGPVNSLAIIGTVTGLYVYVKRTEGNK